MPAPRRPRGRRIERRTPLTVATKKPSKGEGRDVATDDQRGAIAYRPHRLERGGGYLAVRGREVDPLTMCFGVQTLHPRRDPQTRRITQQPKLSDLGARALELGPRAIRAPVVADDQLEARRENARDLAVASHDPGHRDFLVMGRDHDRELDAAHPRASPSRGRCPARRDAPRMESDGQLRP